MKIQTVTKPPTSASIHLDAIRGLAALMVLLSHLRALFFVEYAHVAHSNVLIKGLYFLDGFGHLAVIVFFVLSGFLISSSVFRSLETNRWSWGWYAQNRLTRLYVVLLPALLLCAFWDHLGMHFFGLQGVYGGSSQYLNILPGNIERLASLKNWLGSLVFLQTIVVAPYGSNGPLWSLSNEFWYYVLFPLCLLALLRRHPVYVRLICFAVAVAVSFFVGKDILLLFPIWLMGTALCLLPSVSIVVRRLLLPTSAILLGVAMLAQRQFLLKPGLGTDFIMAAAVAFFLYALLNGEGHIPALYARVARFCSGISYTLYLVHLPLLFFLTAFVIGRKPLWQPTGAHLGLGVIVLLVVFTYTYLVWCLTEANTDKVRKYITNKLSKRIEAEAALEGTAH